MIRPYPLSELAKFLDAAHIGADIPVSNLSIDSRTLSKGDLFIAIKGSNFDGHGYVGQALEAGAAAVLVEDEKYLRLGPDDRMVPGIVVPDTFVALGKIGQYNRQHFNKPVLAITGSCGKTSVKEMLTSICEQATPTLATEGNLNNGFGAPITLSKIEAHHGCAVIELGTSSPGEIDYIAQLTQPDVAMITNAAETHLSDLVDVAGVAHEKGFILDSLPLEGTAILNLDDAFFEQWRDRATSEAKEGEQRKALTFSLENPGADCFASEICPGHDGMSFRLNLMTHSAEVRLKFLGRHQVENACCAALAALAAGIELEHIIQGLEQARPFQRRGQCYNLPNQALIIDETYNANPRATLAAIDQLASFQGRTVMVFGDMLELGKVSDLRHQEVGQHARRKGVDYFAGYGAAAKIAVAEFGDGGHHFDSKEALSRWLSDLLKATPAKEEYPSHRNDSVKTTVLVKGSRGMEMLDIVRFLVGPQYKGER